jgi:hypothetical protein
MLKAGVIGLRLTAFGVVLDALPLTFFSKLRAQTETYRNLPK